MPVLNKAGRLRTGRASEVGGVYLLTIVVHRREPIFSDWRLGRLVVRQIRLAHEDGWANSLAYVVMPDHLHWLVQLYDRTLAELMCRIKSRSSLTVNRALGRKGALWQKGYHDRGMRREDDLKDFARYVVCNPVRAGLVSRVHDYPLWGVWWLWDNTVIAVTPASSVFVIREHPYRMPLWPVPAILALLGAGYLLFNLILEASGRDIMVIIGLLAVSVILYCVSGRSSPAFQKL